MPIPEPMLIGYFARPTRRRPDWPHAEVAEEICSASSCMSSCDWDWINEWRHNEMWVFDSPEIALEVVPVDRRADCDLYAYRLFPIRYVESRCENFTIPLIHPVPLDPAFEKLGYDLVSRSQDNCFECSPLSCNDLASEVPVNHHAPPTRWNPGRCSVANLRNGSRRRFESGSTTARCIGIRPTGV